MILISQICPSGVPFLCFCLKHTAEPICYCSPRIIADPGVTFTCVWTKHGLYLPRSGVAGTFNCFLEPLAGATGVTFTQTLYFRYFPSPDVCFCLCALHFSDAVATMNRFKSDISTWTLLLVSYTTLALASTPFEKWNHATVFNSSIASGSSNVQFVPEAFGFDGPKLDSANTSVFDWWYFQAMAPPLSSFVIVFFTSTANVFPYLVNEDNVLPVWIWASFDNGTVVSMQTHAENAAIYTSGNGSTGIYDPIGMKWAGSRDMSTYHISVNNKELEIRGNFKISSVWHSYYLWLRGHRFKAN